MDMPMKLALGPIPYFWPLERVRAFYHKVAEWPVDIVYVGETVCAKRRALSFDAWLRVADELSEAGKEVVLSTLALMDAESSLAMLERICANGRYRVEANDMAAVRLLSGNAAFIAGPHVNCYNNETLSLLAQCGACRWVAPMELPGSTVAELLRQRPPGLQAEVQAFGRMPLAFSARCFTARAHDLPKDQCDFCCGEYPDGLAVETQEGQALFTINGIQIQSATLCNLAGALVDFEAYGVDVMRIAPLAQGTELAVDAFRAVVDGQLSPEAADEKLASLSPAGLSDGYWNGTSGMAWHETNPARISHQAAPK
jgi:collagenase-like PrtC family protease